MNIALEILIAEPVKCLAFTDSTERGDGQGLGLAAGKDSAAVGAGQNAYIAPDRSKSSR